MFIYKITNKINGKIYIGMDSSDEILENRWKHHLKTHKYKGKEYNKILYKAMRKHGTNNFLYEVIDRAISQKDLRELETDWIVFYDAVRKGYNMQYGGGAPLLETLPLDEQIRLRKA